MSNRIEKINSLLRDEISKIILHDFSFSPNILVTLTKVECSSNLIEAKVYISVFATPKSTDEGGLADKIIKILNNHVYNAQYKINRALRQRPIPKIIFVKDETISRAGKIEELLGKLKES